MDKQEMAMHLLYLIHFNDMLDMEYKKATDGRASFSDMKDFKESRDLLQKACIGILTEKEGKTE